MSELSQAQSLRQVAFDLEMTVFNVKILMEQIFEKLDNVGFVTGPALDSVNSINCFAKCAVKLMADVEGSQAQILKLTGGVAA